MIAVLTGRDAAADGLGPIPHRPVPTNPNEFPLGGRDGRSIFIAPHPPLAADIARFVGEAVAMVIAETAAAAVDGAERVVVDYEVLPSVTATPAAARDGAPVLWERDGSWRPAFIVRRPAPCVATLLRRCGGRSRRPPTRP